MKNKIAQILQKADNVVFAYLFGSYAKGEEQKGSDVDIALFLRDDSLDRELDLMHELQKNIDKEIDMVVLNRTKNMYLIDAILREGIVLKDDPQRLEYEVRKEHEIIDYKYFKSLIDAA